MVLMGPPGVGKGTQGVVLTEHAGLTHVASGDLFRAHIRGEAELGESAKAFVERGELVPDRMVTDIVLDRVLSPDCVGTVFDGLPRTLHQARDMPDKLSAAGRRIDVAVLFTAPRETQLGGIVGRQSCRICQRTFNLFYQPPRHRLEGLLRARPGGRGSRSDGFRGFRDVFADRAEPRHGASHRGRLCGPAVLGSARTRSRRPAPCCVADLVFHYYSCYS
jgi:adenylate kinase